MATGICYTKSGNVKKYDGIVVPAVAKGDKSYNPGYDNIKHDTSSVPGEDHYSFDDPSSYTLVEKGSSARDDCPLIIVTYYPVAPANPCYFNYKKKDKPDSKVYVRLKVSHNIIINGNTYHNYGSDPALNTIDLESGDGRITNILVGLDSNHSTAAFDISFEGASVSNKKIYLLVNNNYYDVTNSTSSESKKCYISKYGDRFHNVGWMYTTGGFDYTFSSNDWESNSLFTQEGTKDSSGGYIPDRSKAKFVVKFALIKGYSHQDCQLTVDITTNK